MLEDPLSAGIIPTREERFPEYRNGEVLSLTFETSEVHICYGLDKDGAVWDFCAMVDNGITLFEDKLSEIQIEKAKAILDDFRIELENS